MVSFPFNPDTHGRVPLSRVPSGAGSVVPSTATHQIKFCTQLSLSAKLPGESIPVTPGNRFDYSSHPFTYIIYSYNFGLLRFLIIYPDIHVTNVTIAFGK